MRNIRVLAWCALLANGASAQTRTAPTDSLLAEITQRGRWLAAYDVAAWHATDAVLAHPAGPGGFRIYVARHTESGWVVSFGQLNEPLDTLWVAFRALEGESPVDFNVEHLTPPVPNIGYELHAAKAIVTVLMDLGLPTRQYNFSALPAPGGQWWVYAVPAAVEDSIFPHGGDVRYRVTEAGDSIVEKRQLHKGILEIGPPPTESAYFAHAAILDDVPEDTDVFLVLMRRPAMPLVIVTEHYYYQVNLDGSIGWVTRDEE